MKKLLLAFSFVLLSVSAFSQKSLNEIFYSPNKVNGKPNITLVMYNDLNTITVNTEKAVNTFKFKLLETGKVEGNDVLLFEIIGTTDKFRLVEVFNKLTKLYTYKFTYITMELGIQKTYDLPLQKI